MKKLLVIGLVGMLVFPVLAQTNQTVLEQATATARASVSTNLNEVIVDILRGVKTAGGEVYSASKTAITKSVDFTMEQAPLVVKEFLMWRFTKAIIWFVVFSIVGGLLFYAARQIKLYAGTVPSYVASDAHGMKWVVRSIACAILLINFGVNAMEIAKISVAPRVYLIEYVVSVLNSNTR